jgi:predicted site-specific integrase-resolvase
VTAPDLTHPYGGMSALNDFCRRNQIGRSFAYEQIRNGKLTAVKLGSRTYIRYEDEITWRNALQTVIHPVERLSKKRPKLSLAGVA